MQTVVLQTPCIQSKLKSILLVKSDKFLQILKLNFSLCLRVTKKLLRKWHVVCDGRNASKWFIHATLCGLDLRGLLGCFKIDSVLPKIWWSFIHKVVVLAKKCSDTYKSFIVRRTCATFADELQYKISGFTFLSCRKDTMGGFVNNAARKVLYLYVSRNIWFLLQSIIGVAYAYLA